MKCDALFLIHRLCLEELVREAEVQMALIARLQHPYIVEFKEAWVEKVL